VNDLPAVDYPVITGTGELSRRQPANHGRQLRHAAGKTVHADSGLQLVTSSSGRAHQFHAAIRSEQKHRRRRHRRSGGHHARTGSLPVDLPSPPTFHQDQSQRSADHVHRADSDSVTPAASCTITPAPKSPSASAFLPGVSRVDVYGTKSAVRIKANPSALAIRGMTIDDLAAAIRPAPVTRARAI
jgi:hydrophobic/amphiphilic exporter-1 (mainly G- bacteria), HAE1 family